MKKIYIICILLLSVASIKAQFVKNEVREWNNIPPSVYKSGFGLHKSQLVQMDDSPSLEEVFLFSTDNGHYPYFDIFKCYYAVVDYYTKEVKFISDIISTTTRELILEDRNQDGKFELYRRYFKDDEFSVDEEGNNLKTQWVYDSIEWKDSSSKFQNK